MSYDENFPTCDSLGCDLLWGHTGFHEAECWHFKLNNGLCIRHQFDCELGGCGEDCSCVVEAWEPDEDE